MENEVAARKERVGTIPLMSKGISPNLVFIQKLNQTADFLVHSKYSFTSSKLQAGSYHKTQHFDSSCKLILWEKHYPLVFQKNQKT